MSVHELKFRSGDEFSYNCAMRALGLVVFIFILLAFAGEGQHDELAVPAEFSEAEIQKDIETNRLASTGKSRVNSIQVEWSPDSIILRGSAKNIAQELVTIRESLKAFPFLESFVKYVNVSADGKSLDLTKLLKQIDKSLPENCYTCFSLPLCAMEKNLRNMDSADLLQAMSATHNKKKAKDLGPGSIVLYRENYHMKDPYHAYIWLSPTLALEKRGSGHVLIRPQAAIGKEYKELARLERKSFKLVEGNKLPSFSSPLINEYWVKK